MASGHSNVSRSKGVGNDPRQARNAARNVFGAGLLTAPSTVTERSPVGSGRPAVEECARSGDRRTTGDLLCPFDKGDFFWREVVEFINQLIDLTVGGGDSVLERRAFGL